MSQCYVASAARAGKEVSWANGKYLCSIHSTRRSSWTERRFGRWRRKRLEREKFRSIEEEEDCFSFSQYRCLDRDDRWRRLNGYRGDSTAEITLFYRYFMRESGRDDHNTVVKRAEFLDSRSPHCRAIRSIASRMSASIDIGIPREGFNGLRTARVIDLGQSRCRSAKRSRSTW